MQRFFVSARNWASQRREAIVLGGLGLAAAATTVVLFYPGYMSYDSSIQLGQARSLVLTDHHPVIMSLLWRYLDKLIPGPLGMLILLSLLYWGGLTALCGSLRRPLWLRAAALLLVGFFPPVYCLVGAIWKDTLMQAALLSALGCFTLLERLRFRWLLIVGLLFALLGLSARHNSVAAAWPLLVLPLLGAKWMTRVRPGWRLPLALGLAASASAMVMLVLLKLLSPLALKSNYWQLIATFDLAGISRHTGKVEVDPDSPALVPGATLRDIRRSYRASNHMTLYKCARSKGRRARCGVVFTRLDDPAALAHLRRNWMRAVWQNPGAYLQHRYAVYREVAGLARRKAKLWFLGPRLMARDYPLTDDARARLHWFASLAATPLFRVWLYVAAEAVALLAAVVFYVRTRSALPLVLCLSGLCYALSLFIAAGAPDYRYSEWTVMTAVLAVLTLLQPWTRRAPVAREELGRASPANLGAAAGEANSAAASRLSAADRSQEQLPVL